jgi:hypothetical protein
MIFDAGIRSREGSGVWSCGELERDELEKKQCGTGDGAEHGVKVVTLL